ncbi:MAG: FkbM family methyltransferase [Spirochaetales bacterium]|nr:FkbM family methyltransferase [Spirochaetales bacterium]
MKIVVSKLPNNYTIEIIKRTETMISGIWGDNFYERDYRIKGGDVVIDIGANQGIFTLFAVHRGARVYAVEPDIQNYKILERNIIHNNVTGHVTSFCCAITRKDGTAALFTPDSEYFCPSTFASTEFSHLQSISKYNNMAIKMSLVKALSLESLLSNVTEDTISILKINAEGAEMDILLGAHAHELHRVKRIVMETHAVYPEKELYRLVGELGFETISYEKRHGMYNTGYLYAEHSSHRRRQPRKKPVAILEIPSEIIFGNRVMANAGNSFSARSPVPETLCYKLKIDDSEGEVTCDPRNTIQFSEKGPHRIVLEVFDGQPQNKEDDVFSPDNEDYDCAEKIVWVFAPDYGPSLSAFFLIDRYKYYEFTVSHRKDFIIPAYKRSHEWEKTCISLEIKCEPHEGDVTSAGIYFVLNGMERRIKKTYEVFSFPCFPAESDFCFSFRSDFDFRLGLLWCTKQCPDS